MYRGKPRREGRGAGRRLGEETQENRVRRQSKVPQDAQIVQGKV